MSSFQTLDFGRWTLDRFSRRLVLRRLLDQSPDCISGLRAFADPVLYAIAFEINLSGFAGWIVRTKILQVRAVALRLLLFDYDAISGTLLRAHSH